MTRLDFLTIGHISKDLLNGKFTLGGTVTYSALTAKSLGKRAGVITAAAPDIDLEQHLHGVAVHRVPSAATTTFKNIYLNDHRVQYVHAVAQQLGPEDVPEAWWHTPIVHLGPIAQEVDEEIVHVFPNALIGITPQGWMRAWDDTGRVFYREWRAAKRVLPRVSVVVFSEEDVPDSQETARIYAQLTEIVVVTHGERGATVYYRGKPQHFPTRPAMEVDLTGAGDVFAAAYLIRFHETGDPYEAAQFANLVASFSVEAPGTSGIPDRDMVFSYLSLKGRRRLGRPSHRRPTGFSHH